MGIARYIRRALVFLLLLALALYFTSLAVLMRMTVAAYGNELAEEAPVLLAGILALLSWIGVILAVALPRGPGAWRGDG